ncbi:uncharacterized protein CCOS01_13857 [Colletotrichum costaricense]|uniref:Uncharacterized protein n=1 Tax=Colletotrichum costaricense TaxID=1209916 RepID=A0AAJ0DV22_9PEZI|nr:uncharacterized protein CCOS01_13857 [Colletotrichum costaricense]KAK1514576.1 hypothetical protein CCOS01_13857 [Colletotrichum costaricense]
MALPDLQLFKVGIEMTFATNHVGHFPLTYHILPKIIKAVEISPIPTKDINISSSGHQVSPVQF